MCSNFNYENRTSCHMRKCGTQRPANVDLTFVSRDSLKIDKVSATQPGRYMSATFAGFLQSY